MDLFILKHTQRFLLFFLRLFLFIAGGSLYLSGRHGDAPGTFRSMAMQVLNGTMAPWAPAVVTSVASGQDHTIVLAGIVLEFCCPDWLAYRHRSDCQGLMEAS
jgi:hypothetical protein